MPKKNPSAARRRGGAARGFTLIEVLVALAIMALGMGALIAATSTGLGNARAAQQYLDATRRAQSRLATVGVAVPLATGVQSGDDGQGFTWELRIGSPQPHLGPEPQGQPQLGLYPVAATIRWHANALTRSVTLQSQRLGPNG